MRTALKEKVNYLMPEVMEIDGKEVVPISKVHDLNADSVMERLNKLGLKGVTSKIGRIKQLQTAYSHFLFIDQEKINNFNKKLKEDTLYEDKNARHFKQLKFIPLDRYQEMPPAHVLDALERATEIGCFDFFEVAKIGWIKEVKDPIVFGRINGCDDRFFVAQWDDDIKVEDLLFFGK